MPKPAPFKGFLIIGTCKGEKYKTNYYLRIGSYTPKQKKKNFNAN